MAPASTVQNTIHVDLPDATATYKEQPSVWDIPMAGMTKNTNSCVTHVGDILRAGGAQNIPTATRETIKWIIANGKRQ